MIFRRREQITDHHKQISGHEARLRALGQLLDERGYDREGLCVLAIGNGFEVTGLRASPAHDIEQHTETINAEDLDAVAARLRGGK